MTCREIMDALEKRWNPSYAMAWDNVGLLYLVALVCACCHCPGNRSPAIIDFSR